MKSLILSIVLSLSFVAGCQNNPKPVNSANTIYCNGKIYYTFEPIEFGSGWIKFNDGKRTIISNNWVIVSGVNTVE